MYNFDWNTFDLINSNSVAGALQLLDAIVGPSLMGELFKRGSWPTIKELITLGGWKEGEALKRFTTAPSVAMDRPLPRDIDIVCSREWYETFKEAIKLRSYVERFPQVDWNRYDLKIVSEKVPALGFPSNCLVKFIDRQVPGNVQTAYLDIDIAYAPLSRWSEKLGEEGRALFPHNDSNWILLCAPSECISNIALSVAMKKSHWHRELAHPDEKTPSVIRKYHKHMGDIVVLEKVLAKMPNLAAYPAIVDFSSKRTEEEKAIAAAKKHKLSLAAGTKSKEFFSQYKEQIHYYYVHDEVHEVIAKWMLYERPSYTLFLRDGEEVATDWSKFMQLPYWRQIDNCIEEALVLALERGIVPQRKAGRTITEEVECEAFLYGLMRICTTIWKGNWSSFARTHYGDIMARYKERVACYRSYYKFFEKAEQRGEIVMKQRGYKE